ncbi:RING finger and transmembrane domain containing protein [Echinococcus multilocularis]|uniref:RING finger and transmembrane domain containing protein n=1 Tax=Echinococcus multilocularis TaxID=6211 RepID=A0A068Y5P8_ECHMU|nr:RING finger and transmembrane domain containing protein [Echinococcus multilocularis]
MSQASQDWCQTSRQVTERSFIRSRLETTYMADHKAQAPSYLGSIENMTQAISGDAKPSHSHGHCHSHHKVHSGCDYPQPHLHNHGYCQQDEPKINPDEAISRNLRPLWIVIPFLLLFLLKEAVLHSTGLWVLVSLFVSSYYLNTRLANATQGFEPPIYALVASVIVCATLIFMHNVWIFKKNKIYLGLFCMPNAIPSSDWVSLLWAVIVVDFSLKILTIFIKSILVYFSPRFFHISTRSAILVWMEFISQFYRSIPPAVTWIRHLTDGLTRSLGFRIVFCLLYILLKLVALATVISSIWPIFKPNAFALPYQTNVVSSLEDQELCNLCLEKRSRDVAILGCNHTFCRNCIDRWLIHFDECPLCSHPLGGELGAWRDGSTSALVHFF